MTNKATSLCVVLFLLSQCAHFSVQDGISANCVCPVASCAPCPLNTFDAARARSQVVQISDKCPPCPPPQCPSCDPQPSSICTQVMCAPNCTPANPINPISTSQCCICGPISAG
ncbi:uncharacterized protein LOC129588837 [Paramacrobiotus metropolitanus]|uniref:uncharacterized protein LOC129588837 n=1 Tax=Paramacrobiotus metropolitanus TaxID=2943436 RepID=UPI002445661D|nr:uncharacterized protein LOC129588837 [Paramacrobiotus metropolitanus]